MKQIIVIIGTVLLGVFICANVILGDTNSFKSAADNLGNKAVKEIEAIELNP